MKIRFDSIRYATQCSPGLKEAKKQKESTAIQPSSSTEHTGSNASLLNQAAAQYSSAGSVELEYCSSVYGTSENVPGSGVYRSVA